MDDLNLALLILNRIKHHEQTDPVKSKVLEEIYSISGAKVRDLIHTLRRGGEPIGSNVDGYFYCKTYNQLEQTIKSLESRAYDMLRTSKLLKEKYELNQMEIF